MPFLVYLNVFESATEIPFAKSGELPALFHEYDGQYKLMNADMTLVLTSLPTHKSKYKIAVDVTTSKGEEEEDTENTETEEDIVVVPNGFFLGRIRTELVASDINYLSSREEIIRRRHEIFSDLLFSIHVTTLGGIDAFAHSFRYFGHYAKGCYRVWCPGVRSVHFLGDFNGWKRDQYNLQHEPGPEDIWSTTTLPHDITNLSKYALLVAPQNGEPVFRQDPWSKYDTREHHASKMDSRLMSPSAFDFTHRGTGASAYTWEHERPSASASRVHDRLKVYECHVGIAGEEHRVHTYREFADNVVPYIATMRYTAIQLMAVPEHPFYGSFGYQCSHLYAPSSRYGTPNDLKYLVDQAHRFGLAVILDIVHTHSCPNVADGLGQFNGADSDTSASANCFFTTDHKHKNQWGTFDFNLRERQVLRYLLSNLVWWVEEYRVDGFRFDAVTQAIYVGREASNMSDKSALFWEAGSGARINIDALSYFYVAHHYLHATFPFLVTIAEEVSGFPTLTQSERVGGIGFDYRMNMGLQSFLHRTFHTGMRGKGGDSSSSSSVPDELIDWEPFVNTVLDSGHRSVCYLECHDNVLVGSQSLACALIGCDNMRFRMLDTTLEQRNGSVDRGIRLLNVLRAIVFGMARCATLTFIGNEWGHGDWLDFPVETAHSDGDFTYARRLWSVSHNDRLVYKYILRWERALLALEDEYQWLNAPYHRIAVYPYAAHQTFFFIRSPNNTNNNNSRDVHFAVNLHPTAHARNLNFGCFQTPGTTMRICQSSDDMAMGGSHHIRSCSGFEMPTTALNATCKYFQRDIQSTFTISIPPRTAIIIIIASPSAATVEA